MSHSYAVCGEENDLFVDPSGGRRQQFTEDCAVCCRPNLITITVDDDGEVELEVTQERSLRDVTTPAPRSCVHPEIITRDPELPTQRLHDVSRQSIAFPHAGQLGKVIDVAPEVNDDGPTVWPSIDGE